MDIFKVVHHLRLSLCCVWTTSVVYLLRLGESCYICMEYVNDHFSLAVQGIWPRRNVCLHFAIWGNSWGKVAHVCEYINTRNELRMQAIVFSLKYVHERWHLVHKFSCMSVANEVRTVSKPSCCIQCSYQMWASVKRLSLGRAFLIIKGQPKWGKYCQ